ncbi:unnamed protein product [Microthlaspi erraticum]|uniref:Uncharacterized protein n=1 Tax=Microthlaspi erraticum TaxID=1685480 RepID=A0A6D2IMB9_9BRAS|nr:unnamed protein product [Microthlaspi erraticum]
MSKKCSITATATCLGGADQDQTLRALAHFVSFLSLRLQYAKVVSIATRFSTRYALIFPQRFNIRCIRDTLLDALTSHSLVEMENIAMRANFISTVFHLVA